MGIDHPADEIRCTLSQRLLGKQIILAVTGSVAAQKSTELARLLLRHGAEVFPVMSQAACRLIHPDLMEWACGKKPILELSGAIEHVALAGNVPRPADLLAVYPATANTLGKAAAGIDDTPVTTFLTTAFGQGLPILMVPAMHQAMYNHPGVQENLKKLRRWGVRFGSPHEEEGKAKVSTPEETLKIILDMLKGESEKPLARRRVVISAGRTESAIDPVRVITNRSSGRMGCALAEAARDLGAQETILLAGLMEVAPPDGVTVIPCPSPETMKEKAESLCRERPAPDLFLAAAAVNDWQPKEASAEKIPTRGREELILSLKPTPKIVDNLKGLSPDTKLILFRALTGKSDEELIADARRRLQLSQGDYILANHAEKAMGADDNALFGLSPGGETHSFPREEKKTLAVKVLTYLALNLFQENKK